MCRLFIATDFELTLPPGSLTAALPHNQQADAKYVLIGLVGSPWSADLGAARCHATRFGPYLRLFS